MKQNNVDWSTSTLSAEYTGKKVNISGWLFDDAEHTNASVINEADPSHPKSTDWRASCWEIHPITGIQLADNSQAVGSTTTGSPTQAAGQTNPAPDSKTKMVKKPAVRGKPQNPKP